VNVVTITAPEISTNGDSSPSARRQPLPKRRRPGRPFAERLTLNVVIGLLAALLAFVLIAALLRDRREMTTVAVAREPIPTGALITPEMVSSNDVPTQTEFSQALVDYGRIADGTLVAARTVQAGEPLTDSAVSDAAGAPGRRVMSIPLESWQAANGDIQIGDQVDVIETTADGSRYVLTSSPVVGRSSESGSGGLVGGTRRSDLVISVEVDATEALALAAAIDGGKVTIVRSTGSSPADAATATPEGADEG
jgi:Flp pilus assembly protein CpaB